MAEQFGNKKIFLGNSQTFLNTREIDNMTLTFNYVGGQWIFSINNMTQNVKSLVDMGYKVRLQLIRNVVDNMSSNFKNEKYEHSRKEKKSAMFGYNDFPGSIDITSQVVLDSTNIVVTDWINTIIFNDQDKIGSASDFITSRFYNEGSWFRKYKFCLRINNVYYTETPELLIFTHYEGPIPQQSIDTNYVWGTNDDIHLYSL